MPQSLRDLRLYNECRKFIVIIYRLTKLLPDEEKYGLVSQARRAVISILANIVEGYGRKTLKDKLHFYNIAIASFREIECYIVIFLDLKYINLEQYNYVIGIKDRIGGQLINFVKSQDK